MKPASGPASIRVQPVVSVRIEDPGWQGIIPEGELLLERLFVISLSATGIVVDRQGGLTLEMSVLLADNATVQVLNRDYRGKDRPTNVLSFPALDNDMIAGMTGMRSTETVPEIYLLGDLVLARETVEAESRNDGKSLHDHFCHLVVHGILHLFGYDHQDDTSAASMEALEASILAKMNIADPYQIAE